jgi:hypothetical protein
MLELFKKTVVLVNKCDPWGDPGLFGSEGF